jgi:hypothetical protein
MEHPSEMLLNTTNLRVQEALFGLVFEETPAYNEIANGTPKLNWIFKLSSDFIPQKSLLVPGRGLEPPCLSASVPKADVYAISPPGRETAKWAISCL